MEVEESERSMRPGWNQEIIGRDREEKRSEIEKR